MEYTDNKFVITVLYNLNVIKIIFIDSRTVFFFFFYLYQLVLLRIHQIPTRSLNSVELYILYTVKLFSYIVGINFKCFKTWRVYNIFSSCFNIIIQTLPEI